MAQRVRYLNQTTRLGLGLGRRLALTLFVSLTLTLNLEAATEPPPRQIRFSVFSADPIENLNFLPADQQVPVAVVFYPTIRSPVYTYRGETPLRFYQSGAVGSLLAPSALVAEVDLASAPENCLLLFSRLPSPAADGLKYRVHVLDEGAARSGPGSLRIFNLSGLILTGVIGSRSFTLNAGLGPSLRVPKSPKVELRTLFRNRLYPAYSETLELKPNDRGLLLLFPPFRSGSLEVQSRLLVDEPPTADFK
jgi:hypothetical protein